MMEKKNETDSAPGQTKKEEKKKKGIGWSCWLVYTSILSYKETQVDRRRAAQDDDGEKEETARLTAKHGPLSQT
jgi:hypothetical protein